MKYILTVFGFTFLVGQHAVAQSDVYLCIDANGKKEYRNVGNVKGCKRVELPYVNVVPAPASVKKPVAPKASSASAPASFPKVDDATQKARDSDRKQILNEELKAEEQKLAGLKKEYNGGDVERRPEERLPAQYMERVNNLKNDIARSEKNIEALKREIGNLK